MTDTLLREALEWYASPAAWTMEQLEGAHGDYGARARAALAAAPQPAQNEGEANAEDTSVPGDLRPLMGDGSGVVGDRRVLIEQARALLAINASGNAVPRVPNLAVSIIERLVAALAAAPQPAPADRDVRQAALLEALEAIEGSHLLGTPKGAEDAGYEEGLTEAKAAISALLARGLRLPGDETMAWAVVGDGGEIIDGTVSAQQKDAEWKCDYEGERIVRVAIRVVEGGDDAA